MRDKLWITAAIKKSSAEKNKLYKVWIRNKKDPDLCKYKDYKWIFTAAVKAAKNHIIVNYLTQIKEIQNKCGMNLTNSVTLKSIRIP